MPLDHDKFKALIHYICWRVDPSELGSVKLNKVLWKADFNSYYHHGVPITGARYLKRQFGPVPSGIKAALKELEDEGSLLITQVPFHGYLKDEFKVKIPANEDQFTADELAIIDRAIEFVCSENTATSISEISHDHIWKAARDGEELPYFTVLAVPGKIDDDEREWARLELESMGR